jgi:hypothetical protein
VVARGPSPLPHLRRDEAEERLPKHEKGVESRLMRCYRVSICAVERDDDQARVWLWVEREGFGYGEIGSWSWIGAESCNTAAMSVSATGGNAR